MDIMSLKKISGGSNIQLTPPKLSRDTLPRYLQTSNDVSWKDQAVLNIGTILNDGDDVTNSEDNQLKVQFDVIVNEASLQNIA